MSLITDTDFLIHSLRLSYLRQVEDPYGPRIISLDPSYRSNPYVAAASLADMERWPELRMPESPQLSDTEDQPSGYPGARLKHTQTIMGRKAGGFGLRVSGKRISSQPNVKIQEPTVVEVAAAKAVVDESSSDEDEDVVDTESMDEGDEFDPDFAATKLLTPAGQPFDPFFEMVTPDLNFGSQEDSSQSSEERLFSRKIVAPIVPVKSALSSMLASSGSSTNPFAEMYAMIFGRGESASANVQVYFPHAREPFGKAMDLNVRKDATVEEVIGFALWNYWEEGWLPKLDEGLSGEEDPRRVIRLSAIGWILRIAEEDGEVDDDFPPPDRMGKITTFNSEAYAILEATPSQIQQNEVLETKIQRRPSRTTIMKKSDKLAVQATNFPALGPGSAEPGSTLGSLRLSTSLGPSSRHGPQIFLRIRVADTADAVHISTTIPVSAGMYMQEALELVCRKRKLQNAKDYALLLADKSILIPLDRTVASLQGNKELLLIKRAMLPQMGSDIIKGIGRTTDPNASIFNRTSDTPEQRFSSALDYTTAYKKYTIYRKMPMLVTRQERTLAIDGVYIHIMPSSNKAKAVFDNAKTSSYHIKSIADCQQSSKTSSIFKLVLNRGAGNKRYDFEAESSKLAAEIVQTVKGLKVALERSGTINKSRRSRQVV